MKCGPGKNDGGDWQSGGPNEPGRTGRVAGKGVRGEGCARGRLGMAGEEFSGGKVVRTRGEVRRDEGIPAMFVRPGAEIFWF